MPDYVAQVRLTNDTTGKVFEPGDRVKDGDFDAAVIRNWIEIGTLVVVRASETSKDVEQAKRFRKADDDYRKE